MTETARAFAGTIMNGSSRIGASIAKTFPEHIPIYVTAALFSAATLVIAWIYRIPLPFDASSAFLELVPKFVAMGVAFSALGQLVAIMRKGGEKHPTLSIARRVAAQFLEGDRPGNAFHALVTMTPLMICFAAMKDDIPRINPFSWDHTFMVWDRIIGFGHQPWELLQPVLGFPFVTFLMNTVYDSWFVIMFGCLFWQAFSARGSVVRMQYLLAFAFSWFIAGNLVATIFSSAGPCFYGNLHLGNDPYAAQMQYLHEVNRHWPIWSVTIQNLLWQSYVTGSGAVSGISAMPSMHVASSALIAATAWRYNKWLGAGVILFTFLIVLGSVHLAWHYAVDSVAGLLLDVLFWWSAGVIARVDARRRQAQRTAIPVAALGRAA